MRSTVLALVLALLSVAAGARKKAVADMSWTPQQVHQPLPRAEQMLQGQRQAQPQQSKELHVQQEEQQQHQQHGLHGLSETMWKTHARGVVTQVDEAIGCVFTVLVVLYFLATFWYGLPEALSVELMRHRIHIEGAKAFTGDLVRITGAIEAMQESASFLAERHFHDKYRSLVRKLTRWEKWALSYGAEKLPVTVKRAVLSFNVWLEVFEKCSMDPERHPTILCSQEKLLASTSVAECYRTLRIDSQGKLPCFEQDVEKAKSDLELLGEEAKAKYKHTRIQTVVGLSRTCCGGRRLKDTLLPADLIFCFVRFTIYSGWHARQVVSFVFGICLAALLMSKVALVNGRLTGPWPIALVVLVDVLLLVVLLRRTPHVYELEQLENEAQELASERQRIDRLHTEMQRRLEQQEKISTFWTCQTINLLDLCDEYFNLVDALIYVFGTDKIAESYTGKLNPLREAVVRAVDGMGPIALYTGVNALDVSFLTGVSQEVKDNINKIAKACKFLIDSGFEDGFEEVQRRMLRFYCFVLVKVDKVSHDHSTGPQVRARFGLEAAQVDQRSYSVVSLDWKQAVYMVVPMDSETLELEVCDARGVPVGSCQLGVRESPGEWKQKSMPLGSTRKELRFDIFYGTSIIDYAKATRDGAYTSFTDFVEDSSSFRPVMSSSVPISAFHAHLDKKK